MATRPPERPGGQETDAPDVDLAIRAAILLLGDLNGKRLLREDDRLRIAALLAALKRLRDHRQQEGGGPS